MTFSREIVEVKLQRRSRAIHTSLDGRSHADRVRSWAMKYLERAALQEFLSEPKNLFLLELDVQKLVGYVKGGHKFVHVCYQ